MSLSIIKYKYNIEYVLSFLFIISIKSFFAFSLSPKIKLIVALLYFSAIFILLLFKKAMYAK